MAPTAYTRRTGKRWRAARLRELGYASYADYLASEHWKLTRLGYFADPDTPMECICGEHRFELLQLHHKTYLRIGAELLKDLIPLCPTCHRDVHLTASRGLAPYDLEDYQSEYRRELYAWERRRRLERRGEEPDWSAAPDAAQRPYSSNTWASAAQARHLEQQDRRQLAKRLAGRARAF